MAAESVDTLCQRARHAIAQGKIEQARQVYLQALGLRSDAPDVHYGLATVCFLLNDLESAAYHFKEVTRLDPLRPGAHINLGAVYNRLEDYEQAIPALRRGIQLDPHRAEGYYNLGLVYRNTAQSHLAVQAYIEATRINPRMVDAHYNLANLYLEMSRYNLACNHYKKVLELRPKWDKALEGLAQAEAALAAENPTAAAPEREAEAGGGELDPQRAVDPFIHGTLLTTLHQATIESETNGRQFLQALEQDIETAIKELSACLLDTTGTPSLTQCVQRFETAMQKMRSAQREMQNSIERVRNIGDRLQKT
jgi:tetratricopeptide (TPR) repeat protein